MESTATKKSEVGSPVILSGRNDRIETAYTKIGTQENKKIAPGYCLVDSDIKNGIYVMCALGKCKHRAFIDQKCQRGAFSPVPGTQEDVQKDTIFCAHRGHGCISQNGYMCTHGPKCEPIDSDGRRFVVFEWIEDGQRLATRHYLPEPVICADTRQAQAEAQLRGRAA